MKLHLAVNPIRKIVFSALGLVMLTGCQMSSGHIKTRPDKCSTMQSYSDYRGDKPTWNEFVTINSIEKCDAGTSTSYKFNLPNGTITTQQSSGDVMGFYELSERSFREMIATSRHFRSIADQVSVKMIDINNKVLYYSATLVRNKPVILFAMNDGYSLPSFPPLWSMSHNGIISGDQKKSSAEFENWFLNRMHMLRNRGGNYSAAFSGNHSIEPLQKKSVKTKPSVQPSGKVAEDSYALNPELDYRKARFIGSWTGWAVNFDGEIYLTKTLRTGEFALKSKEWGIKCKGKWQVLTGQFGTDTPPSGTVWAKCSNGHKIKGQFSSLKPGTGLFEGQDTDGRDVRISYN
ncbi:hypothetical protein OAA86_06570 [Rhodospirillales bacterium]|nr:hypothetical protein [Rhodospirillales bacterium]